MTVKDIVRGYLKWAGYDGLCNKYKDCFCGFSDFMTCGNWYTTNCKPAYMKLCKDCKKKDDCNHFMYDAKFCLTEKKGARK